MRTLGDYTLRELQKLCESTLCSDCPFGTKTETVSGGLTFCDRLFGRMGPSYLEKDILDSEDPRDPGDSEYSKKPEEEKKS